MKNKKMDSLLNKSIDNRLVVLDGDEMMSVVWVIHVETIFEIELKEAKKSNLKLRMDVLPK